MEKQNDKKSSGAKSNDKAPKTPQKNSNAGKRAAEASSSRSGAGATETAMERYLRERAQSSEQARMDEAMRLLGGLGPSGFSPTYYEDDFYGWAADGTEMTSRNRKQKKQ